MNKNEYSGKPLEMIVRTQWQVSPDLFVFYQSDPVRWILKHRRNGRIFSFSEKQYRMICAFDAPGHDADTPLVEREQLFAQKLVQYGIIERRTVIENPIIPPEPAFWHDPTSLATWALSMYATTKRRLHITVPVMGILEEPYGCYICLKMQGQLRGCFGSIAPNLPRLADDIVQNTLAAASWDTRFMPLGVEEINVTELSVDIVQEREQVSWPNAWDTQRYGLQLRRDQEVLATLLPGLEDVNSAAKQYQIAFRKASISSEEGVVVERFTTLRFPSSINLPVRPYKAALANPQWSLL
jgi:AMMECR1 domain-containing protein